MAANELFISGIGISRDVVSAVVSESVNAVAGVAHVGGNDDIATSLITVFTTRSIEPAEVVEARVTDDKLELTVHLSVFYGYRFTELAADVRAAVAQTVREQIGVDVEAVNVCIDGLVFPKE